MAVLRQYRERQAAYIADLEQTIPGYYQDNGLVFPNETGGWMYSKTITTALKRLGKRVGHLAVTARALRHFHASVALKTGTNPVVVSRRIGHAKVSTTTDIYAHSLPGWQRTLSLRRWLTTAADGYLLVTPVTKPHRHERRPASLFQQENAVGWGCRRATDEPLPRHQSIHHFCDRPHAGEPQGTLIWR